MWVQEPYFVFLSPCTSEASNRKGRKESTGGCSLGVTECSVGLNGLVSTGPRPSLRSGGVGGPEAGSFKPTVYLGEDFSLTVHLQRAQPSLGTETSLCGRAGALCFTHGGCGRVRGLRFEGRGEERGNGVRSLVAHLPHCPLAFNISPGSREMRPNAP